MSATDLFKWSKKNYENHLGTMVLETFKMPIKKNKLNTNPYVLNKNLNSIKILEKRVEALELKMNELITLNDKRDSESFQTSAETEMINRLFETIDHKFLKLDYLNYTNQEEEINDIDYFIKCLDHEIQYYESLLS